METFMNKYTLLALAALSQTVAYGSGEKFNKEAHNKYIKEQVKWGVIGAASIPSTKLAWNGICRFEEHIWDKYSAYREEKTRRSAAYKLNPNFKQYCKNTGWILRNQVQNAARTIAFVPTMAFGIALPAALAIVSPIIMYVRHADYKTQLKTDAEYSNKKRA
jgi:hypothetical protein